MNTKMKMLSLALIGAFGYAGVAAADCPTDPVPPWSGKTVLAGAVEIASPGYDGTECRMDARITANTGAAAALVRDDSPSNESSYRAQFLVSLDELSGLNLIQGVRLFAATTEAPAFDVPDLIQISAYGNISGTSKVLGFSVACAGEAGNRCSTTIPVSGSGAQRVEISLTKGTDGELKVWLNNGNESSPDVTLPVNNSAWGGVDSAFLGLATPSSGFRAAQLNKNVGFDQFDSRRTSFIGN